MAENDKPAPEAPRAAEAGARATGGAEAQAEARADSGSTTNSAAIFPTLLALANRSDRVVAADRDLGRDLSTVLQAGADPTLHASSIFQRNTAYVAQDVERALREKLPLGADVRAELNTLATTLPGLTNDRAQALLQTTEQIGDRRLVQSIRQFAAEVAADPKQDKISITGAIENFENKIRLAPRAEPIPDTPKPEASSAATGAAATAAQARNEPPPTTPGNDRSPNGQGQAAQQPPSGWLAQRTVADAVLDSIRAAVRGPTTPSQGFDLPHTPMVDRIAAFEARILVEKEDRMVTRAEKTGQAALDAIQGISATSAGAVLSRINEAARNNPGGMEAVLSEMRPGGQFADLRTQFNTALNTDHAAAAAYDKAASTLARYGEQRPGLDAIFAKRGEATGLAGRFNQLDAEIGEAASYTPSKQAGKTMLDDLSGKVAEIISKAVDSFRAVFSRAAAPGASASPGPSPGP